MNGVHDMGGMHGFGPIVREENEPLFHAAWEARVRAMVVVARSRGYFNIDAFRYGIERMDPAHYLRAPYFERWLGLDGAQPDRGWLPDRRGTRRQDGVVA